VGQAVAVVEIMSLLLLEHQVKVMLAVLEFLLLAHMAVVAVAVRVLWE
tara:strand:- start:260 stop:403 length:144 start_codon:yes stop_codon:yes gene_type:complete